MYASKEILFTSNIQNNMSCLIDREDMLELLGNLLDNAYKWCAKKVVLSVSIDSALFIVVEDDGPGADPVEITQLAKRGVRLDEKVEGHGFGLAIAADIVKDYNGEIHFSLSNDLGGFRADVTLSYS